MILTYPLMSAVQMISARIGRVTGHGLAGNLVRHYPAWLANSLVLLLLAANTINIGADLGAMADATALCDRPAGADLPHRLRRLLCRFRGGDALRQLCARPEMVDRSLLAYVVTLFLVDIPSGGRAGSAPCRAPYCTGLDDPDDDRRHPRHDHQPYLFFWQASEEAEEVQDDPDIEPLICDPLEGQAELTRIGARHDDRNGRLEPGGAGDHFYDRGNAQRPWSDRNSTSCRRRRGASSLRG